MNIRNKLIQLMHHVISQLMKKLVFDQDFLILTHNFSPVRKYLGNFFNLTIK